MANQLSTEAAYDLLVSQVHAPVFFEKLARVYNISPQSQEEARELLLIAGQLRNAHEQEGVKQASTRGNFLNQARCDLDHVLVNQGFNTLNNDEDTIKRASEEAVKNPLIREAALVFGQHVQNTLQNNS